MLAGVTREYDGAAVLRHIDLAVEPGELVALTGPSGSGKTTLLNIIVSLLGAAIGLVLGVFGAGLLVSALGAKAFVSPEFTAWGMGRALLVGILIGVLGGLYPAWRASHLSPARILAQR